MQKTEQAPRPWTVPTPLQGNIFVFGRIGCLDAKTEIFVETPSGIEIRRLEELPEQFRVLSYNFANPEPKKKIRVSEAVKVDSGVKEVFEIEFCNGTKVLATEDHVFFDLPGKEVRVKDLKPNDTLFARNCVLQNRNPSKREDVRQLLSNVLSGPGNGMYGRKASASTRMKQSVSHRGDRNAMKDPVVRERHRLRMQDPAVRSRLGNPGESNPSYGKVRYPKSRFSTVLKHTVRSTWEEEVCLALTRRGIGYFYEAESFELFVDDKKCTYTPDIRVAGTELYIEVKGPAFEWQKRKMKAFLEKYPYKKLLIITNKRNFKNLQGFNLVDYSEFLRDQEGILQLAA